MRITIRYREYPWSPQCTRRSQLLGLFMSRPAGALAGGLWYLAALGLASRAEPPITAGLAAAASLAGFALLWSSLRRWLSGRIDRRAARTLLRLRETDPAAFLRHLRQLQGSPQQE